MQKKFKTFACACEEKGHSLDTSFPVWNYVADTIEKYGETVDVLYIENNQVYLVPRIYIAVHGVVGKDLSTLGFPVKA